MNARRILPFGLIALVGVVLGAVAQAGQAAKPGAAPAGPVVVIETPKGAIEFETYPEECPKTVDHILALVKKNFYRGHRFHRVDKNFVVQVAGMDVVEKLEVGDVVKRMSVKEATAK